MIAMRDVLAGTNGTRVLGAIALALFCHGALAGDVLTPVMTFDDPINEVQVNGTSMFVGAGNQLYRVDYDVYGTYSLVGQIRFDQPVYDIVGGSGYAYIANGTDGVQYVQWCTPTASPDVWPFFACDDARRIDMSPYTSTIAVANEGGEVQLISRDSVPTELASYLIGDGQTPVGLSFVNQDTWRAQDPWGYLAVAFTGASSTYRLDVADLDAPEIINVFDAPTLTGVNTVVGDSGDSQCMVLALNDGIVIADGDAVTMVELPASDYRVVEHAGDRIFVVSNDGQGVSTIHIVKYDSGDKTAEILADWQTTDVSLRGISLFVSAKFVFDDTTLYALNDDPIINPPVQMPSRGDVNGDGQFDAFDIQPFVDALLGRPNFANATSSDGGLVADINGDGSVDVFDIDPFVALLTSSQSQTGTVR